MNILKSAVIKFILIVPIILCNQSLLAVEQSKDENTYLKVARTQLNIAFDNYNKGDISAAKKNLKRASEWLYKAVDHSQSEKVKIAAQKLAVDIDSFRLKLNKSTGQNDLVRFWQQATSLIKRESEHLVHSYIESSTNSRILRHLLDAKMHFYTAEHDLFVSHDSNDANKELNDSLEYLVLAKKEAKPELKTNINKLSKNINEIITLIKSNKKAWKKDNLIQSLEKSLVNLSHAESIATPVTKLKIKVIKKNISTLIFDIQKTNLKIKYESTMSDFRKTISNI